MFSRANYLFWDVTWNVFAFHLRHGLRAVRYVDYKLASRASTPTAEGAASSTAQSGFESQEAYAV